MSEPKLLRFPPETLILREGEINTNMYKYAIYDPAGLQQQTVEYTMNRTV